MPQYIPAFVPDDTFFFTVTLLERRGKLEMLKAGCATLSRPTCYPYLEKDFDRPHAFLGMFDVSARPFVPKTMLTFAVPMKKFTKMVRNMAESFLITSSWNKVRNRISSV